jgi:murein DD-endopeptidase MepM/ murein hydrolase activator NlpD
MKFRLDRKKYYYSPEKDPQLNEIRWFKLKFVSSVVISVMLCLALILSFNHFYYDFLGLRNKITSLNKENQLLHQQLSVLTSKMKNLETTLSNLSEQGNELRLLVDMPVLDEGTQVGGTGGAVPDVNLNFGTDALSQILSTAFTSIEKLSNIAKVQDQSYKQILSKYEYNKGLFASMPALKPMVGHYSTRGFGVRMHPILGMLKTHEGLDIINDVGTPVVASGDGTVEIAGPSGGGYGLIVMINHGFGYQTLYGHLSKILVREGHRVKRGDIIAKSGRSGLVSGPHLHYEVRYKGVFQNPAEYFLDDVTPQDYSKAIAKR